MGKSSMPLDAAKPPAPSGVRQGVLVFLALGAASAYLTRHCVAVANTTIQKELGWSDAEMGDVLGAFALGYLLFQVPGGWLANRIGTRRTLPLLSAAWSLCTVWTSAVASLFPMIASRFAYGVSQAGLVPSSAQVIRDWFPVARRGQVAAAITVSMSLGAALTMELTARLMESYHWRSIFRAYSLVGVGWAALFYLYFRTRPEEHPRVNAGELERIRDEPSETEHPTSPQRFRWRMLCHIGLVALCVQSFFRAAGYNLFVSFFPAFLEYSYQVTPGEAGRLTKWPLIGVMLGGLIGGWLVDRVFQRTRSKWLSRTGTGLVATLATAALTWAATWASSEQSLVAVLTVASVFAGMANPAAWAATIEVGGARAAVAVGVMNMAGAMSGVIVTPLLGRLIAQIRATNGNWDLIIYLHAAFYLAAGAAWLLVDPSRTITGAGSANEPV